jgi:hypothetical protein
LSQRAPGASLHGGIGVAGVKLGGGGQFRASLFCFALARQQQAKGKMRLK